MGHTHASAMYSRRKLKHWRRRKTELEKMGIGYNEGRYKLSSVARQDPADHVYCCALNSVSPNHADKLATTAGPRAYVYRLTSDGNMVLMQCYVDEDLEEDYFACCWCASAIPGNEGAMLAVAGGYKGVVRVIDCTKEGVYVNLRGHGGGVNDVKAHPTSPHLLLTASKDESCRLWNMDSKVCIAVFAGALGHRNEVLSVDFKAGLDPYDAKEPADVVFVSGAMDNQIKVWSTDGYDGLIKQSDGWREDAGKKFPTAHVQTPSFSSHKVHGNYVDCVRWFGNLILSKSVEHLITLFQPEEAAGIRVNGSEFRKVQDYPLKKCDIWFMRFSLDPNMTHMCAGNTAGEVFVWRMHARNTAASATLVHKQCKKAVRQTAMSADGKTVIAACDGGSVWRWDLIDNGLGKRDRSEDRDPRSEDRDPRSEDRSDTEDSEGGDESGDETEKKVERRRRSGRDKSQDMSNAGGTIEILD